MNITVSLGIQSNTRSIKLMNSDIKAVQQSLKTEWTQIRGSLKPLEERKPPVSRYLVRHARVIKRNAKGVVCFNVEMYDTNKIEKWPLSYFINGNTIVNKTISDIINDWTYTAQEWPNIKRKCVFCKHKATKGDIVCEKCYIQFGQAIHS